MTTRVEPLTPAEIERYAIERLIDLAIRRSMSGLSFVERRQMQNTTRWLREHTDGSRMPS